MDDGRRWSNDWFERDVKEFWDATIPHLVKHGCRYLEIGVCEGRSMLWVLRALEPIQAYGIDPWLAPKPRLQPAYDIYADNALHNLGDFIADGVVKLYRESSDAWLRADHIPEGSIDFLYDDSDHRASATLTDAVLGWRFLRRGGLLVFDDYQRRWHLGKPWTHEGVDAFLHAFEQRYSIAFRTPKQVGVVKIK